MAKYIYATALVLKEKTGWEKYTRSLAAFIKSYKTSMNQYGEAIIKVKAK